MKIIIGLGNPGKKYERTRHNLGFLVLDKMAKNLDPENGFKENKKLKSAIVKIKTRNRAIILAKPQTFMNLSGEAAEYILSFYKAKPENLLVIHDDMDLPLGKIRFSQSSGPAGHNGVRSIIDTLKTNNFTRLRIGTAPDNNGADRGKNFVLGKFTAEEKIKIKKAIETAAKAAICYINEGFEKTAAKYN